MNAELYDLYICLAFLVSFKTNERKREDAEINFLFYDRTNVINRVLCENRE